MTYALIHVQVYFDIFSNNKISYFITIKVDIFKIVQLQQTKHVVYAQMCLHIVNYVLVHQFVVNVLILIIYL